MKRMLDHVQTQTLLAAHSAEVRLKAEAEREVRGQKIPSVPTQVEIDNHNLTHEPFKEWCEVCTMSLCIERAKTNMLLQITHIQVTAFCPMTLDTAQGCLVELTSSHAWS